MVPKDNTKETVEKKQSKYLNNPMSLIHSACALQRQADQKVISYVYKQNTLLDDQG